MKRLKTITALLLCSAAIAAPPAVVSPSYGRSVSLTTPIQGIKLEAALDAMIKSAGMTPVLGSIPDVTIKVSFKDQPLDKVVTTLIETYGAGKLAAVRLPGNILVVSDREAVQRLDSAFNGPAVEASPAARVQTYTIDPAQGEQLSKAVALLGQDIGSSVIGSKLIARATPAQQIAIAGLIADLGQPAPTAPTPLKVTRSYPVKSNAEDVAKMISTQLGTVASGSNALGTVFVTGTEEEQATVARLLIPLAQPEANSVVSSVMISYQTSSADSAKEAADVIGKAFPMANVTLASSISTLFVQASPEEQQQIRNIIARYQTAEQVLAARQQATASSQAAQAAAQAAQAAATQAAAVKAAADAAAARVQMTYPLFGDNREITDAIKAVYPEATVTLLDRQSQLVVIADAATQVKVVELLQQINTPASAAAKEKLGIIETDQQVITLSYARPYDLAQRLVGVAGVKADDIATLEALRAVRTETGDSTRDAATTSLQLPATAAARSSAAGSWQAYVQAANQQYQNAGGPSGSATLQSYLDAARITTASGKTPGTQAFDDAMQRALNITAAANGTATAMGASAASANGLATPAAAPTTGGALTRVDVSPTIVADERSNALILTGRSKDLELLRKTIASLDVPTQQVRMHIRIEQVNNNATDSLGLDWKVGFGGFSIGAGSTGITTSYAPGYAPFSITANLDALKKDGKSNTVMDTNFIGANNEATRFTSGGTLNLLVTTTTGTGDTRTQKQTFKAFPYGLSVSLVPHISPDGNIEVKIATRTTSQPQGSIPSNFTIDGSELETRVNFKSGQEVVLGGLVSTTNTLDRQGVPILSSIPILGKLFSKTVNTAGKTTLLIVVSGEVIDNNGRAVDFSKVPGLAAPTLQPGSATRSVPIGKP